MANGMFIRHLGDRALLFAWNERVVPKASMASLAAQIRQWKVPWIGDVVPGYATIAVHCRGASPAEEAAAALAERIAACEGAELPEPRTLTVPVRYGGEDGPDLEACCARCGLTEEQFIERHSGTVYEVAMIGFAPGFPYLSGLDDALAQPRHETPRKRVPAGSVGIAGGQTGIYPVASPGGWQIVGRTDERLFRPGEEEPFALTPGDRVRFVPAAKLDAADEPQSANAREQEAEGEGAAVLTVVSPGLLTTVQDLGRPGWQAWGVSVGGAMDSIALRTANILAGNGEEAACLEMTLVGAAFRVERDTVLAVSGGLSAASIDGERLPAERPVWVRAGATISFGSMSAGCRTYLAIAGGIDVPVVMGSRSTDVRARIGGVGGQPLERGTRLQGGALSEQSHILHQWLRNKSLREDRAWTTVPWSASTVRKGSFSEGNPGSASAISLRVLRGAEWGRFAPESRARLFEQPYRVDVSSDRMGIRLKGSPLRIEAAVELSSHGVAAGTIQVPPGGQPIILGAGCQPTGGYPKLAHVIGSDLPLLGQAAPGALVRFVPTNREEAAKEARRADGELAELKAGVLLKIRADMERISSAR
ncbi:5-oxoprolinase subunit PxpB [Cohnella faecalis]|uniref:5-oxoprolinase subunit PxpB n=1 Tax=Cohnella faecalis TaxID=2315694 RepID=A0A398CWQ5_9BACL|nr:5-oxoprolinase subunit PxpB [Cohnella faecalis]RIE03641.1 5-oxoprolinase subunit PxpB [Cohnella faecalis]